MYRVSVILLCRIILFNYLAKTGKQCGLVAAMAVSIAWNCFTSARSLEQPINAFIFNQMLADELKQTVARSDAIFVHTISFVCFTVLHAFDTAEALVYADVHCES